MLKKLLGGVLAAFFFLGAPSLFAADCVRVNSPLSDGDILYAANYEGELNNLISCVNNRLDESGGTVAGNVVISGSSGLLLPDVNPPTAQYATRHSFAKAWAKIDSTGDLLDSYNISSVSHPSTGYYEIVFNTDFANANFACVATANGGPGLIASTAFPQVGQVSVFTRTNTTGTDLVFQLICFGDQ